MDKYEKRKQQRLQEHEEILLAKKRNVEIDSPIEGIVEELEPESEAFVRQMLDKQGTNVTDESLIKELGSRVADVIRSVK
jgi:hypothetical protein